MGTRCTGCLRAASTLVALLSLLACGEPTAGTATPGAGPTVAVATASRATMVADRTPAAGTPERSVRPAATAAPSASVTTGVPADEESCGTERIDNGGQGRDARARECLWRAYQGGHPATFVTTRASIDSAPTTYTFRVTGRGPIAIAIDALDPNGAPRPARYTCATMERYAAVPSEQPAGFRLQGCIGGGATMIEVP
jgi:hypothetical protein